MRSAFLSRIGALVVVLTLTACASQRASPDPLRNPAQAEADLVVRRVVFKDSNGRLCGHIGVSADGHDAFEIVAIDGATQGRRMRLKIIDDSTELELYPPSGDLAFSVECRADSAGLNFVSNKQHLVSLGVRGDSAHCQLRKTHEELVQGQWMHILENLLSVPP